MSNRVKLKPPLRNLKVLLARAGAEVKPGTVNLVTILHDDWCRSLVTQSMLDCRCAPEMEIEPVDTADDLISKLRR